MGIPTRDLLQVSLWLVYRMQRENAEIRNFQYSEEDRGLLMPIGQRRPDNCQSTSRQAVLKLIHSRVKGCCTDLVYFMGHFCSMSTCFLSFNTFWYLLALFCELKQKRLGKRQEKDMLLFLGRNDTEK